MFFDPRQARKLLPGEHLMVDGCPGLRLVATSSRTTWTYRYKTAKGLMKQVAIGQYPGTAVQAAVAQWLALRDQRVSGVDPRSTRNAARKVSVPEPIRFTVSQLVDDFITKLAERRKPAGALAAERMLRRFLAQAPELACKEAATVTRADAYDALAAWSETPMTAGKLRALLGAAWDLALDAGRMEASNWWRQVLKGRLRSRGKVVGGRHVGRQRRVLSLPEVATLLAWLPAMHELARDVTCLYLWTCARGAEICGMRPEHVRKGADGWWWTVPKAETKNANAELATDLRVPLVGNAMTVVQRRLKTVGRSGWLFEDRREEQYTQHDYSSYIYGLQPDSAKVRRRESPGLVLPVVGWTPHDLRRTGRTLLSSLGCPNEIGEAILGHLPLEIVGTYNAYSYDAERRYWLCKLSQWLDGLSAGAASLPARP